MDAASTRSSSESVRLLGDLATAEGRPSSEAGPELLARLADGVVHDLRNPLNTISIYLELLERSVVEGSPRAADAKRHLATMREQVRRLDAILRRYARFVGSRQSAGASQVDLAELVGQAVEVCGHAARRNQVEVSTHLAEAGTISGDPGALGRAVVQLLMRAIDARAPGGRLRVAVQRSGEEAILSMSGASGATPDLLEAAERIADCYRGAQRARAAGDGEGVEVRLPLAAERASGPDAK